MAWLLGLQRLPAFAQVEEIALLNTTLRKSNGTVFLYPNIALSAAGVCNLSRSGFHTDSVKVHTLWLAAHHYICRFQSEIAQH